MATFLREHRLRFGCKESVIERAAGNESGEIQTRDANLVVLFDGGGKSRFKHAGNLLADLCEGTA